MKAFLAGQHLDMPHGMLITRIANFLKVDLSEKNPELASSQASYGRSLLYYLGITTGSVPEELRGTT